MFLAPDRDCDLVREAWIRFNRPYIDLGEATERSLHVKGVDFAYHRFFVDCRHPKIQAVLPHSFRSAIVRRGNQRDYDVESPLELAEDLRTERWSALCRVVIGWRDLSSREMLLLVQLLGKLCLYNEVIRLTAEFSIASCTDANIAEILYHRAQASFVLDLDYGCGGPGSEFEYLAIHSPDGCLAKINSLYQMVIESGKYKPDRNKLAYWLPRAENQIEIARESISVNEYHVLRSRYYRSAAYLPYLDGDAAGAKRALDDAVGHAGLVSTKSEFDRDVAAEIMLPALESYTKTALWTKEFELAEEMSLRRIDADRNDARGYMEAGEVYFVSGCFAEAIKQYRIAVLLGPPGDVIALHMIGQCYENLNDPFSAFDAYASALRLDPFALATASRLKDIGGRLRVPCLEEWTKSVQVDES